MTAEHGHPAHSLGQTCSTVLARLTTFAVLVLVVSTNAGCAAVGGIFKAGVWLGLIIAALVIVVVLFLVRRTPR
jgi:uncharacterized membrane protein YkvI